LVPQPALLLARSVLLAIVYYLMVVAAMRLRFYPSTLALLFPSNALLVAVLVLSPKRHWLLYLLAVVPAHFAASHPYHVDPGWMAYQVASNSVLGVACALILQRFKPEVLHLPGSGRFWFLSRSRSRQRVWLR